jgi:asparagine synthase (glutamine-hydrolysing)
MCGIAGYAARASDGRAEHATLLRMLDTLVHRGPDGDGAFVDGGVGLGIRRLAIVDPVHGDQPLASEDGSVVVVCNGEIYDAPETRARLRAAGHVLRTTSDVEVIPHLYEEHGLDFVHHLRGMFALALWDARRRRLVLARDRLGIKPLCWREDARGLWFASEAKAILAASGAPAKLAPLALRDALTIGFVRTPRTMFAGIERLPAGHLLVHERDRVRVERWWDVRFPDANAPEVRRRDDDWVAGLRDALTASVRLHMRADVPVGVMLSGGLDSSSVAALMRTLADADVGAYSVGFDVAHADETRGGGMLSDHPGSGLVPHTTRASVADLATLPWGLWCAEDPAAAASAPWRMRVAALAARDVKVVLTGEGSDEALGGYPWYHGQKVLGPLAHLPLPVRRALLLGPLVPRLRPGLARLLLAPPDVGLARFRAMMGSRHWSDVRPLLAPDLARAIEAAHDPDEELDLPDGFRAWHPFDQLQYVDLKLRMADLIVAQLDRETMAYSLEARVPFLDHVLLELCCTIPRRLRMRGLVEKDVLRRAMRGLLPDAIRLRRKRGTQSPVDEWLRAPLLPEVLERALSRERLAAHGYFDADEVRARLARHRAGEPTHGRTLLAIAGVQVLHELFVDGAGAPERPRLDDDAPAGT